ncbi:ABC transporter substrate-binding protein [Azospirillum sp. ST 5-10]|uniref:ABC transporter substrate-binding protein n=1 Tax=unclassified Azospirillum TaxID=2630922 RepID=UPI003F49FF33
MRRLDHRRGVMRRLALALLVLLAYGAPAAADYVETPVLADQVTVGLLPPVAERLPEEPSVVTMDRPWQAPGRHGGDLRLLMARAKDTRIIYVYSYARLVAYTPDLTIVPDILERFEVEEGRVFTLHLRKGHRWSDGHPFTTEDFRYWWEDMAQNDKRYPLGPPAELMVEGRPPVVEILDESTVRYSWERPNPFFLPMLAGAKPVEIYAPAHYLKRFHPRYTDAKTLADRVAEAKQKNWQQLHNRKDDLTEFNNPDLPTLQPWVPTTAPPADRFVFVRNPYFHRVDAAGRQLPYIDRVVMSVADGKIIPAKTGAGESDLQARYLRFDNYTFLKQGEKRNGYRVHLWRSGTGAQMALYPNLNARDPVWRAVMRDVRFRRALSLAVNRDELNQVIYFGLAQPSNNTVLPESPLWRPEYQQRWADFDLKKANALLDAMGLEKRNLNDTRLLPDGRPMEIVVETAGESTEETDALELVADSWRRLGILLFTRPSQLDVFRNRIFAGETLMAIAHGVDNAIPTPQMSPAEFVPRAQTQYQWPAWGQYHETKGQNGEPPDLPAAKELEDAFAAWRDAVDPAVKAEAWHRILEINADQVFTIGLVSGVPQPVVVADGLRNVPEDGLYNYDPGAHFGIYRPDSFWFEGRE